MIPNVTSGTVTKAVATLSGTQSGRVDAHAAGTEVAAVAVTLGDVSLTLTSAAQAQAIAGHFAMLRPQTIGMDRYVPMPVQPAREGSTSVAVTFTETPGAAGTRENAYSPALRRGFRYIALTVGPIQFRIMDTIALESAITVLRHAHTLAVTACADGHEHRANPTAASWRPRAAERLRGRGSDWIER